MYKISLSEKEFDDLRRAIIMAIQISDKSGDLEIADRLEKLKDKLEERSAA